MLEKTVAYFRKKVREAEKLKTSPQLPITRYFRRRLRPGTFGGAHGGLLTVSVE
jgi:hypothetical protein